MKSSSEIIFHGISGCACRTIMLVGWYSGRWCPQYMSRCLSDKLYAPKYHQIHGSHKAQFVHMIWVIEYRVLEKLLFSVVLVWGSGNENMDIRKLAILIIYYYILPFQIWCIIHLILSSHTKPIYKKLTHIAR